MIPKIPQKLQKWLWPLPLFLISLVFLLDRRYFTSPPLRSDDWNLIVEPIIFKPVQLIQIADRRPFQRSLLPILSPLFNLQITWYYLVNWFVLLVSAGILYLIIKKSISQYASLALPVAAIYLIYPVNYARTWLIIFLHNFALLIALLAILWLILYAQKGKVWYLLLANTACLLSLGTYEASLGILMLAAALLIVVLREIPQKRRLLIATFFITGAVFISWRTYIQPTLLNFHDFYLSETDFSIPTLLQRYGQGFFIFFYNWVGLIFQKFGEMKYWVFVAIISFFLMVYLALTPRPLKSAKANMDFPYQERVIKVKSLLGITLMGALFWAAGYVPVIFLWAPAFYGDASRVNYSSIPGAALALVAGLTAAITWVVRKKESIRPLLTLMLIPLILLGMVNQVHSQNIRFQVWDLNKAFWQEMFAMFPNWEPGTKVVIVLQGYENLEPFEMLPFRGDWEAESALRVLYNEENLFSEYYYINLPAQPDNWKPAKADFSRLVLVFYDIDQNQLRLIEDPTAALGLTVDASGYDPAARITEFQSQVALYRFLVD